MCSGIITLHCIVWAAILFLAHPYIESATALSDICFYYGIYISFYKQFEYVYHLMKQNDCFIPFQVESIFCAQIFLSLCGTLVTLLTLTHIYTASPGPVTSSPNMPQSQPNDVIISSIVDPAGSQVFTHVACNMLFCLLVIPGAHGLLVI